MKKNIERFILLLLLLPLLAFYPAWGQKEPRGDVTILVFDAARLFEGSRVGRDIRKKVEALGETLQEEINEAREELEGAFEALDEQRSVLPPATLQSRSEELRLRQLSKGREFESRARAIQAGQQKAQRDVLLEMRKLMDEIAEERNAHLVLERTGIFHYAEGLDVTDDLIRRLNKVLTTVDVTPINVSDEAP